MAKRVPFAFAGDILRWAAWLYHVESRTQNEIAEELKVSRQTVANYLSEAMNQGLIQVQLRSDIIEEQTLGAELRRGYNLTGVHIIPTPKSGPQLLDRLGLAGGQVVHNMSHDGDIIGVAFGRTVQRLAALMPASKQPATKVLQVAGCSLGGSNTSPEVCASLIASKLSAHCANLFAPAYCSTEALTASLSAEPTLVRQFGLFGQANLLVFGIGQMNADTRLYLNEEYFLNNAMRDEYLKLGAVGLIYGRFIDKEGQEIDGPLRNRTMAIELVTARAAPTRLAICGGREKTEAVAATLRAGFATHLVTDEKTAKRLLKQTS